MKVVLLFGLLLVGAYATTVSNWDLSTVSEAQNIESAQLGNADWSKNAAVKGAANQGYTARYTQSGKSLKLSLAVQKEQHVRVTDSDRLLFGMEGSNADHERAMANTTLSRDDVAALCETALGKDWEGMVQLPAEELSYVEALRLAASLNEYNLLSGGSERRRGSHAGFDCICHGTPHHFPAPHGYPDAPYWGIRVLLRNTRYTNPGHAPYGNRDCILCDHNDISQPDTAEGFMYDCRYCCSGECVAGTGNEVESINFPGWDNCDYDFEYDSIRANTSDPSYNYYRLNDVGSCRVPRVYHCEEEVHRWCETCDSFLNVLTSGSDTDAMAAEFAECKYCDLVVGANPYICNNCSHAIDTIYNYGATTSFRGESSCDCEEAMWQIAHSTSQRKKNPAMYYTPHHEGDHYEGDHHEYTPSYDYSRDYDYGYNRDYDYGYNRDYDYRPADYDYSRDYDYGYNRDYDYGYNRDYDYSRDYDYGYNRDYDYGYNRDYDYRPADYDYGYNRDYDYGYNRDYDYSRDYDYGYNRDYDYRPADYDYGYNRDYDYGYSRDYSNSDYDYQRDYDYAYRPAAAHYYATPDYDYDYRGYEGDHYEGDHYEGDHYEAAPDYDYRPADYDYRPADYGYDYDYRGDGYGYNSDYTPDYSRDYDYGYNRDYDYGYNRDYDYRPADYDYRPADYDYGYNRDYDYGYNRDYSYDYRPSDYGYDYGRDYDYGYNRDYDYGYNRDYDYRPADYDYRPADYDYGYNRDYDYGYNRDYDYGYNRDYDYAPSYDYRPSYDYDYRPEGDHYEGDHYEGDHYEGHRR